MFQTPVYTRIIPKTEPVAGGSKRAARDCSRGRGMSVRLRYGVASGCGPLTNTLSKATWMSGVRTPTPILP
jgi:hypothetical protein